MPKDHGAFAQALLDKMTLVEKIGQLQQSPYYSDVITGHLLDTSDVAEKIKAGKVGSILSVYEEKTLRGLQELAVYKSRLGIPLLFCFDVIHGFKTAFPVNLAMAHSFDPDLIERVSKAVAYETSHGGIHLTFSPMVDIVRDPRWGRVMESNGEDPYLSRVLAKAYVKGYQGNDLSDPHAVAACVKHFAGYGFAEAGRDYNTVDFSNRVLFNTVLPPFKAAIEAGVSMVMTSFNTVFDIPATANAFLLQDILRDTLGFKNVVISDFSSTEEIIDHKVAADHQDVADQCFNAGIDMEMGSTTFQDHLESLIHEEKVDLKKLDAAVLRILVLKSKLGLFENPFRNLYEDSAKYMLTDEHRALAKEAALKSMVLLKNDSILPLSKAHKIAIVGTFSESQDMIGEWPGLTEKKDVVTMMEAFKSNAIQVDILRDIKAVKAADLSRYDRIILTLGEASHESGEGYSKADINLSPLDLALLEAVSERHADVVAVIFSGRPLILTPVAQQVKAILQANLPGTEAGNALYELLFGINSPSGKLAMTYPYHAGQVPIYYNHTPTGRPLKEEDPMYRYRTHYIDVPNEPLYPFGFGLNYGDIRIKDVVSSSLCDEKTPIKVTMTLKNHGSHSATEVLQGYIEALTYSVSRPVNELKRFERVTLNPGETKSIEWVMTLDDFRSYNKNMQWTAEKRPYHVKLGFSSKTTHVCAVDVKDSVY